MAVDTEAITELFAVPGAVAIVTGAGSGIGEAAAHLLAKAGRRSWWPI